MARLLQRLCIFSFLLFPYFYISVNATENAMLTQTEKKNVVAKVSKLLAANYVFPEVGEKMGKHVNQKMRKGEYNKINDPGAFAERLTSDLREISHDRHLWVLFDPKLAKSLGAASDAGKESIGPSESEFEMWRWSNFGIVETRILDGNVGYMDLRDFAHPKYGGEIMASSMKFLSNCNALIIDLRRNGGGWGEMVALLCSYFFDTAQEIPLTGFYDRPSNKIVEQTKTTTFLPSKPMPDIPLYILISENTFSAAEEFSYNLQQLKRAIVVGQRSRGGANNPSDRVIDDRFILTVPEGRPINAVTKTNWEGVGVKPDIETSSDQALNRAYQSALETLQAKTANEADKFRYGWCLEGLSAQLKPVTVDSKTLAAYAGNYGPEREVLFDAGSLYYARKDRPRIKMIPISKTLYRLEERDDFRLQFDILEGTVKSLTILFNDNRKQVFIKLK
jgi:hypothetical protein